MRLGSVAVKNFVFPPPRCTRLFLSLSSEKKQIRMRELWPAVKGFLKERFSLRGDTDYEQNTLDAVRRGVMFKGVNLWTLIFATLIASIGLNVNSTAVIIGAMLISPLMGPILGVGLGTAQYDFPLIKKSFKNLLIATLFSIATSWLYFCLTPLAEAQSELLARTSPTIWDVLIALAGGIIGMVAVASREKGNPIAGVAIATALMPPLCTAGFGLAVGNVQYFVGALYLYIINSVMIALGTFLVAKLLKYPVVEVHTDKQRLTKRIIALVTVVIIAPSIFLAYRLVKNTVYEDSVNRFVATAFDLPDSQVLSKELSADPLGNKTLKVFVIGTPIDSLQCVRLRDQMARYGLSETSLEVVNVSDPTGARERETVSAASFMSYYRDNVRESHRKDSLIAVLQSELSRRRREELPVSKIAAEVYALFPEVDSLSVARSSVASPSESGEASPVLLVVLYSRQGMEKGHAEKVEAWLKERLEVARIELFVRR